MVNSTVFHNKNLKLLFSKSFLLVILISIPSAIIADYFRIPLAWMLGPMLAISVAALAGIKVKMPKLALNIILIIRIIRLRKFIKIVDQFTLREMESGENDIREVYVSWLKVKTNPDDRIHLIEKCLRLMMGNILGMTGLNWLQNIRDKISKCIIFHNEINNSSNNSSNNSTSGDTRKRIDFMNLRTENYLVYWVVGNYLVQDLDEGENNIRYLGMVRHGLKFNVKTLDGHRFYLVPHRLDIEPPYHPQTDKEFFIEPYCEINIHEGTQKIIFIDNKESLSELNRWKFNALKLDYLVR